MLPKLQLCIGLFLIHFSLSAQADKIPLHSYKFSQQIKQGLVDGSLRIHAAAQDYSYIGKYKEALSIPNEVEIEWGFDQFTTADSSYLSTFKGLDAVELIIDKAADEQVIMINEAHHKPQHRMLTTALLDGLYEKGFRYLGIEALTNCAAVDWPFCDTTLMERGYALNSPLTGTYVKEPLMGKLIRQAIAKGFKVFAYEKFGKDRDWHQAKYVAQILDKNPDAKILIHAGWYHILEEENGTRRWLADYFQERTGIDPFTIYQDILIERDCSPESPFFQAMDFDRPSILVNENGDTYNGFPDFKKFDALVYYPRTKYILNRPDWLLEQKDHQIYSLDKSKLEVGFPCLVKAYLPEEENGVPVDIIELEYERDPTVLVLAPGTYRFEIEDLEGNKQNLSITIN